MSVSRGGEGWAVLALESLLSPATKDEGRWKGVTLRRHVCQEERDREREGRERREDKNV